MPSPSPSPGDSKSEAIDTASSSLSPSSTSPPSLLSSPKFSITADDDSIHQDEETDDTEGDRSEIDSTSFGERDNSSDTDEEEKPERRSISSLLLASPKVDVDLNDLTSKNAPQHIHKYKTKLKDASNPVSRYKARKKLSRIELAVRVRNNWVKVILKWTCINISRNGDVPRLKRFLETLPDNEFIANLFKDEGIMENMARSAVRFKYKGLLDYLVNHQNVDVNCKNNVGFALLLFTMTSNGLFDQGKMLSYMIDDLDADPFVLNDYGQNLLFFCTAFAGDNAIFYLTLLVDKYGLDPLQIDNFGASVLHFCVLYSKMDVLQFYYDRNWHIQSKSKARWIQVIDALDTAGFMPDAIMQARKGWRARGLIKYADSASPLALAILHNNGNMAKFLMGFGSEDRHCILRKGLFVDGCKDLEMVSVAWPELLPDVLSSFAYEKSNISSGYVSGGSSGNNINISGGLKFVSGGFSQVDYAILDLIGDLSEPIHRSPLAIFCKTENPAIFEIPIVELMIRLKWSTIGRRKFVKSLIPYMLILVFFWIGTVNNSRACRLISAVPIIYSLIVEELLEFIHQGSMNYFTSVWNYLSTPSYISILTIIYYRDVLDYFLDDNDYDYDENGKDQSFDSLLLMFSIFCLILRSLEFLIILPSTSVFVNSVVILTKDIATWGILYLLFLVAYASAFNLLLRGEEAGFETFGSSLVLAFAMSVSGEAEMPFSENPTLNTAGIVLYISFSFLVTLLYLNVLIAIMSKSFARIEEQAVGMSALALAKSIVTWESTMHVEQRKAVHDLMFPGDSNVPVSMTLSTGLGFDLRVFVSNCLRAMKGGSEGSVSKHVNENDMLVTIFNGLATTFTKAEKGWKQQKQKEKEGDEAEAEKVLEIEGVIETNERLSLKIDGVISEVKEIKGLLDNLLQHQQQQHQHQHQHRGNDDSEAEKGMEQFYETELGSGSEAAKNDEAGQNRKRDLALLEALEAMGVNK